MTVVFGVFIFLFGIVVGSFLNVCIHRMPQEKSIVFPASHCVHCEQLIIWYDNIPLLSYLMLGGKCRNCHQPISFRYFFIELLNGLSWLGLWFLYGASVYFFVGAFFISALIAVTATDLETGLIPDAITLPGMIVGLIVSTFFPVLHGETVWYRGLMQSAIGLLGGGAILLLAGWFGNIVFRKDTMGGGDIKLLAMMGAFLGFKKSVLIFFISPIFALPIALYLKLVTKKDTLPYGPYLALGGVICYLTGNRLVDFFFYFY